MKRDYRILEYKGNGYFVYRMHEVYYTETGEVKRFSGKPVVLSANTIRDLKEDADLLIAAFSKPVLKNYKAI